MKINKIHISNFRSFDQDQIVDFSSYGEDDILMIAGDNRDDPGMDSNGAGKTSLMDAICWCKLGKVPTKEAVEDIIKGGEDRCEVTVYLTNGQHKIKVTRSRRRKKRSSKEELKVWIDSQEKTERTNSQTQELVLKLWGFDPSSNSYLEDYTNTTYFPASLVKSIVSSETTSRERFDLITRFLQLLKIDRAKAKAKNYYNQNLVEITKVNVHINNIEGEITNKSLEDIKAEFKKIKVKIGVADEEIREQDQYLRELKSSNTLYEKLETLKTKLNKSQRLFSAKNNRVKEAERNLKNAEENYQKSLKKLKDLENKTQIEPDLQKLTEKQTHYNKGVKKYSLLEKNVNILTDQLDNHLKCPNCEVALLVIEEEDKIKLTLLDVDSLQGKVKEMTSNLDKLEEKLSNFYKIIELKQKELEDYNNIKNEIPGLKEVIESQNHHLEIISNNLDQDQKDLKELLKETQELNSQIVQIEAKLEGKDCTEEIKLIQQTLDQLKANRDKNLQQIGSLNEQKKKIKENQEKLDQLKQKKIELIEDNKPAEFWVNHLDEMKRWIIESFLPELEDLTNYYLSEISTSFKVRLHTIKEKKSSEGEFKPEFNITVLDSSGKERGVPGFSKGESKRIAICVGFALRQLTLNQGTNNFNYLMIDEIIDSLDKTGIIEFVQLLNKIPGLKFLISHNNDVSNNFSNIIMVVKENGNTIITQ